MRELISAAIAFSIGGAALLGYNKARWPAGHFVDLRTACRDCPAVRRALVEQNAEARRVLRLRPPLHRERHRDRPFHGALVDGIASALPQRTTAWKALEGSARHFDGTGRDRCAKECVRLPDHPTIKSEWYFWSTVVGVGWLIALASLSVRWRRGGRLLRRQIVGFATVTVIMIAVNFLFPTYAPFPYLQPIVLFALWPPAVVISIAIAVLHYHLYDVRLVIRRLCGLRRPHRCAHRLLRRCLLRCPCCALGRGCCSPLPMGGRRCSGCRSPSWPPSRCGAVSKFGWSAGSLANGATH